VGRNVKKAKTPANSMTVRQFIKSEIGKGCTEKTELASRAVSVLGCTRSRAYKVLTTELRGTLVTKDNTAKKDVRKITGKALIDDQRLDHAKIVRNALADFGKEDCAFDDTFRRDLCISTDRWRDVRDMEEFLQYQVMLPTKKRIWCHPKQREILMALDGVTEVR